MTNPFSRVTVVNGYQDVELGRKPEQIGQKPARPGQTLEPTLEQIGRVFGSSEQAGALALGVPAGELYSDIEWLERAGSRVEEYSIFAAGSSAEANQTQAALDPENKDYANEIEATLRDVVRGDGATRASAANAAPSEISELAQRILQDVNSVNDLRARGELQPLDETERQIHAMGTIGRWWRDHNFFRNEGQGTGQRLAGNVLSVAARAGLNTAIGTFLRSIAAFEMQKVQNFAKAAAAEIANSTTTGSMQPTSSGAQLGQSVPWTPEEASAMTTAIGALAIGLMVALQLGGAIRDLRSGAATTESIVERFVAAGFGLVMAGCAAANGRWGSLSSSLAGVAVYSLARGLGSALVGNQNNVKKYPGRALALATGSYAGAQLVGTSAQNALGLWPAASANTILLNDRYTDEPRTAQEIAEGAYPWGIGVAFAGLNAVLEMFDDLQSSAINRAFNTSERGTEIRAAAPEMLAQLHAAALKGMMDYVRFNRDASPEAYIEAGAEALRSFRNTELEGLRMSLARAPVSQTMIEERVRRAYDELSSLGYCFDRAASSDGDSIETQNNRVIAAYISQSIFQLKQDRPLKITQLFTSEGLINFRRDLVEQFLTVEAHRQSALITIFSGLYAIPLGVSPETVANNTLRVRGVNGVIEGVEVAAFVALVYPELIRGISSRHATAAQTRAENERRAVMDSLQSKYASRKPPPTQVEQRGTAADDPSTSRSYGDFQPGR